MNGLDPFVEGIIDHKLRLRGFASFVHWDGLWGLSIGLFLNVEKKLTISWQSDLSILVYEHGPVWRPRETCCALPPSPPS